MHFTPRSFEKLGMNGRRLQGVFFAVAVAVIVLAIYRIVDHGIRKWLK
jgi:hypothetical protein